MQFTYNDVRIKYDSFGQGPVVLFLSENRTDSQLWNPLAATLIAARFRVILVEFNNIPDEKSAGDAINKLLSFSGIGRVALCGLKHGSIMKNLQQEHPQRIACSFEPDSPDELTDNKDANRLLLNQLKGYDPRNRNKAKAAFATVA